MHAKTVADVVCPLIKTMFNLLTTSTYCPSTQKVLDQVVHHDHLTS